MEFIQAGAWTGDEFFLVWSVAAVKGLILLGFAAISFLLLRRNTAAFKHFCWTLAMAAVLLLPVLAIVTPKVEVDVLPERDNSPRVPIRSSAVELALDVPLPPSPPFGTPERGIPAPVEAISWQQRILTIWLLGALVLGLRFLVGIIRAEHLVRNASPVEDADWQALVDEMAERLNIRTPVRLLTSADVRIPLTWGVRRPVVVTPASAETWSREKRRCVLAHEMAHIRRMDCLTQGVASLACVLHWFNPLAWRGAHWMRLEREKACDAAVLTATRARASAYAGHLLEIARGVDGPSRVPAAAVAMAKRSQLEGRLLSILDDGDRMGLGRAPAAAISVLAVVIVVLLAAVHPTSAKVDPAMERTPHMETEPAVDVGAGSRDATAHSATALSAPARAERALADPAEHAAPLVASSTPVTARDVVSRSFSVAPDGTLELDIDVGNVRVRTANRNTVDVEVRRVARGRADERDFEVAFRQDGSTIGVVGRRRSGIDGYRDGLAVDVDVTVPMQFNLDLETSGGNVAIDDLDGAIAVRTAGGNLSFGRISGSIDAQTSGGNVSVDGADGSVDVSTSGGNIHLGRVGGTVAARTSGGNVTVEEVFGDIEAVTSGGQISARLAAQPQGDCLLRTSGGSITIYIAEDVHVDVEAETSAGSVETDVPVQIEGTIEKDRLRGRINGGGPTLVLDTSAGDIRIRRL